MKKYLLLSLTAALLSACGTATKINADGSPNGELHWPDPEEVEFEHGKGTFPNLENLSKIRAGMSRDQLYDLIGRPHFTEGFHVREWNYLFYFNTPGLGTDGVSTCEYKVLFDKDLLGQNYYWRPIDPVDGFCPPSGEKKGIYTLNADALFAFDRSDLQAINAKGREELQHLADELKTFAEVRHITITGHTDRLGDDAYNAGLSLRRAETIKAYLVSEGLPAAKISAQGMGENNPVVQCSEINRQSLIACLAPNRRVEVAVDGYGILAK